MPLVIRFNLSILKCCNVVSISILLILIELQITLKYKLILLPWIISTTFEALLHIYISMEAYQNIILICQNLSLNNPGISSNAIHKMHASLQWKFINVNTFSQNIMYPFIFYIVQLEEANLSKLSQYVDTPYTSVNFLYIHGMGKGEPIIKGGIFCIIFIFRFPIDI